MGSAFVTIRPFTISRLRSSFRHPDPPNSRFPSHSPMPLPPPVLRFLASSLHPSLVCASLPLSAASATSSRTAVALSPTDTPQPQYLSPALPLLPALRLSLTRSSKESYAPPLQHLRFWAASSTVPAPLHPCTSGVGPGSMNNDNKNGTNIFLKLSALSCGITSWLSFAEVAQSSEGAKIDMVFEIGELFELGIQLSYLLVLLGLLGAGTFFVIRQVLVRRELDLSAKELQEQVRSGDATATEYFELGAVMLRRKFYPAATKYLQQAIEKWDRDEQDLAQVYNALGVSYVRDGKLEKGIAQFEKAVKLQPGYVTAWNNLGDAYEKKKDLKSALKAFEEVILFDPNNKIARPRRDALRERVRLYKGVSLKSEKR